jgi:Ribbon-helix-helix protein, copG family
MSTRLVELRLDEDICRELQELAHSLGLATIEDALRSAVSDWIARRKSEIGDRDPNQRYFVNEALDELISKKR